MRKDAVLLTVLVVAIVFALMAVAVHVKAAPGAFDAASMPLGAAGAAEHKGSVEVTGVSYSHTGENYLVTGTIHYNIDPIALAQVWPDFPSVNVNLDKAHLLSVGAKFPKPRVQPEKTVSGEGRTVTPSGGFVICDIKKEAPLSQDVDFSFEVTLYTWNFSSGMDTLGSNCTVTFAITPYLSVALLQGTWIRVDTYRLEGDEYLFTMNLRPGGTTPTPTSDSDGDGVPDGYDQCLGTPAGVAVDDKGCPIEMQLSVSTDKPSYTPLEKGKTKDVAIVVTVKTDGNPVPGAAVSGHVELPDGGSDALSFVDAGGGEYKASYTLENSFPEGTYTIKVNAKKGTSEGTGEGSFDLGILSLRGFVTDGHTDSFGKEHRLVGVPVTLSWDDVLLPTVYTDAVGCYEIKDQSIVLGTEKEGLLMVALIDKDKTIKIVDKSYSDLVPHPDGCVYATTNVFKLVTADDLYRDIDLSKTNDFGVPMTPNAKAHLDDNAAIYYHTYQAREYARHLGIKLDLDLPLEIGTYAIPGDDAYWTGPPLTKKPTHIALGTSTSDYSQWDKPRNREWHEFGHHVMADAFGNVMPYVRGEGNHYGYKNAHTTDSWIEGWAEFYSCLVAFHTGSINWRVYPVGGNLDVNIKFWDHTRNLWWEELAIAGILVDIRDGKELIQPYLFSMGPEFEAELNKGIISDKLENIFKTNGFPLSASATVITEKKPVKRWRITDGEKFIIRNKSGSLHVYEDRWELADDDEIELSDKQIWGVLKQKRSTAGVGNGYIFDVKDVYDAFNDPATQTSLGYTTAQLDKIFISHGAFNDANGNRRYDSGETVGNAAYPAYPNRRKPPLIDGSYILFGGEDSSTGAQIDADEFTVEVKYEPPYDIYDYQYTTKQASPNKLYFALAPTEHPHEAYITAHKEGYNDSEELVVESSFYFAKMAEPYDPSHDYFLEHQFSLAPATPSPNKCVGDEPYLYVEDMIMEKTVEIPIMMCNAEDLANMDLDWSFDASVLKIINVTTGSLNEKALFDWNEVSPGKLKIAFASSKGVTGSGTIAVMKFEVIGNTGDTSTLTGTVTTAGKTDGTEISVGVNPGKFTVGTSQIKGDCDGDGELTERDALAAIQMCVKKGQ